MMHIVEGQMSESWFILFVKTLVGLALDISVAIFCKL